LENKSLPTDHGVIACILGFNALWRAQPVKRIIIRGLASFPAQLGFAVAQSTVARHRYLKHAVNVFFT
jgi:hypothetical protein